MEVWQDAQDLACDPYNDLSLVKDHSFADQLNRAAVSISNNIAEGAERETDLEFARFLGYRERINRRSAKYVSPSYSAQILHRRNRERTL